MNVYDFDNTIYQGDSTVDLVFYLLGHYPKTWSTLPRTLFYGLGFVLHMVKKKTFKENLYRIFSKVDMERVLPLFVEEHKHKIKPFYLKQKQATDCIITASPEFTVKALCATFGIGQVMGSLVDPKTGKYQGENCHGKEKVRRFYEIYDKSIEISEFYSDSTSDEPLACLAKSAFMVKGEKVIPWKSGNS